MRRAVVARDAQLPVAQPAHRDESETPSAVGRLQGVDGRRQHEYVQPSRSYSAILTVPAMKRTEIHNFISNYCCLKLYYDLDWSIL